LTFKIELLIISINSISFLDKGEVTYDVIFRELVDAVN